MAANTLDQVTCPLDGRATTWADVAMLTVVCATVVAIIWIAFA